MPEDTPKPEQKEKHLEKLTVKELRELAAGIPHERAISDMKKEELIAFLKEAKGVRNEKPTPKKKPVAKARKMKPEIKDEIRKLKALQREAREAKAPKKAALLRRQISHWKKRLRHTAAA